jgi:hypothetical protein
MDRRRFLKAASGLFVPALPALILPGRTLAQSPVLPGPGLPVASGGALGLQTNLGAFFSLDNTLNDDTGAVTALTNNNTVTFVSSTPSPIAAVSNSAKFVAASSQSLSHADATGINVAGIDFSLQMWFYSTGNNMTMASKDTGGFGAREFWWQYTFGTGSSNPVFIQMNSGGSISSANIGNNAWRHAVFTYNATTKGGILYLDGASAGSFTYANNPAGTSTLYIGAHGNGGPANFWTGNLSLFGVWRNRILSSGDVTLLYNSGAGLSYAAML